MNNRVLNTIIQEYINNNLDYNLTHISLKGTAFKDIETREIIVQIEGKKKSENKLPTWFNTKNIYYPNKINIEQSSSEITALYKSQLISGYSLIDITGGFGVDCYYFSEKIKDLIHCEIDKELSEIVKHNYKQLKVANITTQNVDGINYLRTTSKKFDWIYVDPSRRHQTKGKIYVLKDCIPNITEHLELLFKRTNNILIKTSPLLDITIGINELKYVNTVHIIAVNNDVKELLWVLEKDFKNKISIQTINIKNNNKERYSFKLNDEAISQEKYNLPLTYLYEPNSAILKAGAFKSISQFFKVSKLHKHSHLYTSQNLISFPGRCFKIIEVLPYNKKTIRKILGSKKANISIRNFPETVKTIREKFNIKDGGNLYVFFTTNYNSNKIVIITKKA